ncbi:MAG: sporulation protein YqfD [Bacillota bacterium]|nr:sporulation protein YqfD [Bacillota bacterium]
MNISGAFKGYARINIKGDNIEAFTNNVIKSGIDITDIHHREDGCSCVVPVNKLTELRYLAHLNNVYFIISYIGGLPRLIRILKAYRIPAAVFLVTLVFLVFYCRCILWVQVDTGGDISQREAGDILSIADEYGIAPGLWRRDIDWDAAAHDIMAEYPNLAWVGFDRTGVIMTIEIVAKDIKNEKARLCGDVIAKKDGVIRSILVLEGQKAAEQETPVKKGDVLISGEINYIDAEGNVTGEPRQVHAKGLVEASVWYTAEASVSLKTAKPKATGRETNAVIMSWQGKRYTIWGSPEHDYEEYKKVSKALKISQSLSFTGIALVEVVPEIVELSREEAEAKAKKQALTKALKGIPKSGEIIAKNTEILTDTDSGVVKARATVETRENIGKFQSFTGDL